MLSINTNLFSLNTQNALSQAQQPLATSMQRLSTGLRINSAADDAAGLAIATKMASQVNGMNQAVRNANDAVSLLQTASGSLTALANNLQTIRTLAIQSENATNSASNRAALNTQAAQLIAEIDRVAQTAQFNGINLLDGTFQNQSFQVGAFAGQTITIASISSARTGSLTGGSASYSTAVVGSSVGMAALAVGDLSINGIAVSPTMSGAAGQNNDSAWSIANAINQAACGVTATAIATTANGQGTMAAVQAGTAVSAGITINGFALGSVAAGGSAVGLESNIVAAINAMSISTGVTATLYTTNTGVGTDVGITLTAADGRDIVVAGNNASLAGLCTPGGVNFTTLYGSVTLASNGSAGILIGGANVVHAFGGVSAAVTGLNAATANVTGAVSSINISTQAGANTAISTIDAALTSINNSAASLGAYQNRFTSAISNLQNTSQNMSAAQSRIMDADYAAETANMTQAMITQQAGIAVLAQANTLPQQILALLPK